MVTNVHKLSTTLGGGTQFVPACGVVKETHFDEISIKGGGCGEMKCGVNPTEYETC